MTRTSDHLDLAIAKYDGYQTVIVNAGHRGTEEVVPPAGPDHAFTRDLWARRVEVTVSPTGRSVRVYVDGVEVKP